MAGLGIAAGAFMKGYAEAKGLKSKLEAEKQQQELNAIRLQRERDFDAAQKELADMHKSFLDTNYDFVNNKPYEQAPEGGITPPGAMKPTDPYTDSARVKAYYDRITPLLEKQAYASGKDFLGVRKQVDDLRKNQFVERVGAALSMIEAGDEAGIKNLQAVYDMYPDGRKITGGKINEDGTVLLQYEQNGQAGERLLTKEQLVNYGKLALNPADAAKLRFQLIENDKQRQFTDDQRRKGEVFTDDQRRKGEVFTDDQRRKGENFTDQQRRAAETYELPFKQGALGVAQENARSGRISAEAAARNAQTNAEIKRDTLETNKATRGAIANAEAEAKAQKHFNTAFGLGDFKVKTDEEVKALLPKQKEEYAKARAKAEQSRARSNAASGLWDLNGRTLSPSFITSALPLIEQRIQSGSGADGTDADTGLPYVNINGKKVLLPKD